MKQKWSVEKANEWYQRLGWLRGCNFIGSDCANRLDMFQRYKCEEKLATAERELELAQKIGFNTVRIWANFDYITQNRILIWKYLTVISNYVTNMASG